MKTLQTVRARWRGALLALTLVTLAACCATPEPPRPIEDVGELTTHTVEDWLQLRFDAASWAAFSAPDAGWRSADDLDELAAWFPASFDPDARWDFRDNVVRSIRSTQLYADAGVSDAQLLGMLQSSLAAYRWSDEGWLRDLIAAEVTGWLDAGFDAAPDEATWDTFRDPHAGWRDEQETPTLEAMGRWFREELGPDWDLAALVTDVMVALGSTHVAVHPERLPGLLRAAFDEYEPQG